MKDEEIAIFHRECFRTFHYVLVAQRAKALHWLGEVADEDAGLAIRVFKIRLAVWAIEEISDELAGYLWVLGYGYLYRVNGWGFERGNLANQVRWQVLSDGVYLSWLLPNRHSFNTISYLGLVPQVWFIGSVRCHCVVICHSRECVGSLHVNHIRPESL